MQTHMCSKFILINKITCDYMYFGKQYKYCGIHNYCQPCDSKSYVLNAICDFLYFSKVRQKLMLLHI